MQCVHCGKSIGFSSTCPYCGAIQPEINNQQHNSYSNQASYEMGESLGAASRGILIAIIIVILLPVLIFNPLVLYLLLEKRKYLSALSKKSKYFIISASTIFSIASIGILYFGIKGTNNFNPILIKSIVLLGSISIFLILISIILAINAKLKEKNGRFSNISFIVITCLLFLTSSFSLSVQKILFDFPVNGETRQSKRENKQIQQEKDEQNKIEKEKKILSETALDSSSIYTTLQNFGYIDTGSIGIAGSTKKINDNHFQISSKQDSSNNADIFMLSGENDSPEFQQLVEKYRISNKDAVPGNWFISFFSKNTESNYATRIKTLKDIPKSF